MNQDIETELLITTGLSVFRSPTSEYLLVGQVEIQPLNTKRLKSSGTGWLGTTKIRMTRDNEP